MKRFFILLLSAILLIGCFSGCNQKEDTITPTEPSLPPRPTAGKVTEPEVTEPEATGTLIAPQGAMIENLVCTYTIGTAPEQTVENPTASFLYQFLIDGRADAEQKSLPTNSNIDINTDVIFISFQKDGKQIFRMWLYADDYAAIPVSKESNASRYYQFTRGSYASLKLTLENN